MTTAPRAHDPRPDFSAAAAWAGSLVAQVDPARLDAPTPCDGWSVRDLLEHMVTVLDRLVVIADGGDPFSVPLRLDDIDAVDWPTRYASGLAAAERAWADDAVLAAAIRAPFGTMPGAQVLGSYVFEYLTHGWDLATATGQDPEAPAELAERTLAIARTALPEERRGADVPFGAPVAPRPDAGATERLANWLGHSA